MKPKVGIIMGSDSDLPVMKEATVILEKLHIPYEINIVSAHRTPDRMYAYAKNAAHRGLCVIIAGAGGAAHLPGMTASLTTLPVIGVPVKTQSLDGLDALLSIAQMPPGVPVASVAVNGAKNAGLLAAKILALSDKKIAKGILAFQKTMKNDVLMKATKLERSGFKKYLSKK